MIIPTEEAKIWHSYPMFCYDSSYRRFAHAFNLDRARAWSGNFIIPEQQSGPGGQGDYFHDNPEPGEMRRMTYTSIARGADSLIYFRWRTCRFGAEEYWCGILDHDNIPRRRYYEAQQIGAELSRIGQEILGTSVHVDIGIASADFDNRDAHSTLSMGLPSPDSIAETIHRHCFDKGLSVGCVHPSDDLSDLRLYFIPHWTIIDRSWLPNLEQFVKNGGVLVVGARSGTKDQNNNVIAETPPGILRQLCGISVTEYSRCNDLGNCPIYIKTNINEIPVQFWYEILNAETAQSITLWQGRHLNGLSAISCNKVGSGKVYYVGTYLTDAVVKNLLPTWIDDAKVKPLWADAPSEVEVVLRQSNDKKLGFFINHSDGEFILKSMPKGIDLITGKASSDSTKLDRNGVAVIKTD